MCAPTVLVRCTLDEFMVLTCGLQRPRAPTGSGTWTSTGSTATNYTVTGLTNGTAYTFRVRAVNSIGESDASTEATATPSPIPIQNRSPNRCRRSRYSGNYSSRWFSGTRAPTADWPAWPVLASTSSKPSDVARLRRPRRMRVCWRSSYSAADVCS